MEKQDIDMMLVLRQTALMLLFISLFNRFVSMTFVLNFTTGGVNGTLLFALIPLSSIAVSRIKLNEGIDKNLLWLLWAIFVVLSVIASIDIAIYAALSSALALQVIGVLMLEAFDLKTEETKLSLVLATVLQYFIYAFLGYLYIFSSQNGRTIFYLLLLISTISIQVTELELEPHPPSLFAIYPYLNFLLVFLGVPALVATWTTDGMIVSTIPGNLYIFIIHSLMTISAVLAYIFPERVEQLPKQAVAGVYVISLIDVLILKLLPPISISLIVFILLALLLTTKETDIPKFKRLFFVQQFVLLLSLFLYVSAGNWAFLPSVLGDISHGLAWLYLFVSGVISFVSIHFLRRSKQ